MVSLKRFTDEKVGDRKGDGMSQFSYFSTEMASCVKYQGSDETKKTTNKKRLDTLRYKFLSSAKKCKVVQELLLLPHGQAPVETGF